MELDNSDLHLAFCWGDGQICTGAVTCLVARFYGRSNTDFSPDSRGNDGDCWYFSGCKNVSIVRAFDDSVIGDLDYRWIDRVFDGPGWTCTERY